MGGSILIAEGGRVIAPFIFIDNKSCYQPANTASDSLYTPFLDGKQMGQLIRENPELWAFYLIFL
jgi:hypothetical protein